MISTKHIVDPNANHSDKPDPTYGNHVRPKKSKFMIEHDDLLFHVDMKAFLNNEDWYGTYLDRLGKTQKIHKTSLYGSIIRKALLWTALHNSK